MISYYEKDSIRRCCDHSDHCYSYRYCEPSCVIYKWMDMNHTKLYKRRFRVFAGDSITVYAPVINNEVEWNIGYKYMYSPPLCYVWKDGVQLETRRFVS